MEWGGAHGYDEAVAVAANGCGSQSLMLWLV